MDCYLGVDIGGTSVKYGLFSAEGILLEKWGCPTRLEKGGSFIIPDIADTVRSLLTSAWSIKGIGLGIPGPVDDSGNVEVCVNLGWGGINPAKELEQMFTDIPVYGANDGNLAALGEAWQGAGANVENLFMVTLGTGVGGGAVIRGLLIPGLQGLSGEIGHIPVDSGVELCCNCGNKGCLDQIASAGGIVRVVRELLEETGIHSVLSEMTGFTSEDVVQAAKGGDKVSIEALRYSMGCLGKAFSYVTHIIDPDLFLIGGGVSAAGPMLLPMIREGYDRNLFLTKGKAEMRLAGLGSDAGIYGAAKLAMGRS